MKNERFLSFLSMIILLMFMNFLQIQIAAQQQPASVKVYPSTLRIEKGKSKTITAAAFDSSGNYITNQDFSFTSNNTNIASVNKSIEGYLRETTYPSKNLADVRTVSTAGTTDVYASLGTIRSNSVTVLVDDPNAAPIAVINGDNNGGTSITTKVGEPIEINAEASRGVKTIEWNWGDGDKTTDLFSATHAYLQAGTYTLQLSVTNSNTIPITAVSSVTVTVQNHIPCDLANTVIVANVGDLQTAYNSQEVFEGIKRCILLEPGVYDGNLFLAPKNFSQYVTIGTTALLPYATVPLPDIRNRITPDSPALVTIRSSHPLNFESLRIENGNPGLGLKAGMLRFVGINFAPKNNDISPNVDADYIIQVGEYSQTLAAHNPEKVIFQHCVINPPDNIEVAHGMLNNGYKVSVISSWFGNIKTKNPIDVENVKDSQAIFSLSGRGAHVYNNNFLEAGAENILYGGTGCNTINCGIDGIVPTNIEMRRNFLTKRLSWRTGINYSIPVKNLFEAKTGRRIYAEGNLMTNFWDGVRGVYTHALVFRSTVGNVSGGYLWSVVEDVTFENNRISHIQGGIATATQAEAPQYPSKSYNPLKVSNIRFKNNVFDDTSKERFAAPNGAALFVLMQSVDDLILDHITVIDPRDNIASNGERALYAANGSSYRPQITNSVIPLNERGFDSGCDIMGIAALDVMTRGGYPKPCLNQTFVPFWTVSTNVFPKIGNHLVSNYPTNNSYPDNYSGVGLVNYVTCNVTESCEQPITNFDCVGSPCNDAGSDYQDIGAHIPLIAQRIDCTESGIGTNCSPAQTSYSGFSAPMIPATIEAENFDIGRQGAAYNEVFGTTGSGVYRNNPIETVDVLNNSSASYGYAVFQAAKGEWLEYTIRVPRTKVRGYHISVRYASAFNDGKFHLEDCGYDPNNNNCTDLTGQITAVSTGGWSNYQYTAEQAVSLSPGNHTIRLVLDENSTESCKCVVANFDAINFR